MTQAYTNPKRKRGRQVLSSLALRVGIRYSRLALVAVLGAMVLGAGCGQEEPGNEVSKPAASIGPVDDPSDSTSALTVIVANVRPDSGYVMCSLFDSEEGFDEERDAVCQVRLRSREDRCKWTLHGVPPGNYAVAVFQDLDDDGILDQNAIGIPTEPYGFSNNPSSRLGPPAFEEARFTLKRPGVELEIRLR